MQFHLFISIWRIVLTMKHCFFFGCYYIRVRKIINKPLFKIVIESIDVVDEYIYLGTTLNCNGSLKKTITKQISQAKGALFSLIAKAQRLNLPIDIVVELDDQLVLPI